MNCLIILWLQAETKERLGDYEAKVHLMNHINNSKNILPQVRSAIVIYMSRCVCARAVIHFIQVWLLMLKLLRV